MHSAGSAVVTGGGAGIGEAIALKLGEAGYAVTIGDIGEAAGVAAKITAGGGHAQFVPTDVTDEESVRALMETAAATYGSLDVLVANAGIPEVKAAVHELDLSKWQRVLDVNLSGVALCNKWAVATILEGRRRYAGPGTASVINMASILAHVGQPNSNAYSAAKAAVVNFTRSAALTYAKEGIRFNAVSPGYVDTALLTQLPEETRSQMISKQPIGRLLRPEEIANVVLFLAGDSSSALTGSVINADGGYTAV
ncbi:SDR family NAD(P)-dependent oxidoreductase [Pseudarthrobacter defluvii]|uniref:SDR family NAD(P)-dependent oxidoreductase n=1 Tax=Pseudarthrobacter defluvii TaxID=410837 RepID=UPI0025788D85|nr:SDR family oxidoreductase [Pseudarthrobacter defluvii]WJH26036.1 SDR family oxidoreductase [Pseudarthrobacter defluvii]